MPTTFKATFPFGPLKPTLMTQLGWPYIVDGKVLYIQYMYSYYFLPLSAGHEGRRLGYLWVLTGLGPLYNLQPCELRTNPWSSPGCFAWGPIPEGGAWLYSLKSKATESPLVGHQIIPYIIWLFNVVSPRHKVKIAIHGMQTQTKKKKKSNLRPGIGTAGRKK